MRRRTRYLAPCLLILSLASCASQPQEDRSLIGPQRKAAWVDAELAPLELSTGRVAIRKDARSALEKTTQLAEGVPESIATLRRRVRAVISNPEEAAGYLALAKILRRLQRLDAAESALRSALDRDPEIGEGRKALAALISSRGRRLEAVELYRAHLDQQPLDGDANARLAVELYYLGEFEAARNHLEAARRLGGQVPEALPGLLFSAHPPDTENFARTRVEGAVRVDAGGTAQAVETTIVGDGSILVAGWNDQREGTTSAVWRLGAALSTDGGATWNEGLIRPTNGATEHFEGDPFAAFDPRSGEAWVGGVHFYQRGSVFVARKRPGNPGFDPPILASDRPDGFYDKPLMAVGRGPDDPSTTHLYVAFSDGLIHSSDFGESWSDLVPMTPFEIYYQPKVGPDGVLWILSWDSEDGIWLRRSDDGGATVGSRRRVLTRMDVWGVQEASRVPGEYRVPPLPSLAIAGDGTLYVVYCDTTHIWFDNANLDLYLVRSSDGGVTWSTPRRLNRDTIFAGDQFAPWLEIDPSGRLHVAFLDTRYQAQDDIDPFGWVDVTYAFSDDQGASWHETRVTESSSSSADAVWVGGDNAPDYQFLGDYLGLTVDREGRAIVVYGAASGGDFDIFSSRLEPPLLADGFESGTSVAWSLGSAQK